MYVQALFSLICVGISLKFSVGKIVLNNKRITSSFVALLPRLACVDRNVLCVNCNEIFEEIFEVL